MWLGCLTSFGLPRRGSHYRGLVGVVALLPCVLHGCAVPKINSPSHSGDGYAFCIRGLFDVFSLGLNDLAKQLRQEGINAFAISGPAWPRLGEEIRQANLEGRLSGPLVFVGHSYGADDAIRLAHELDQYGIDVELLVLLDATNPPPVPGNVVRCVHLYRPALAGKILPGVFAGNPVVADPTNHRTVIRNLSLAEGRFKQTAASVGHMNIDASPLVHELVIREVVAVCRPETATKAKAAALHQPTSRRDPVSE